MKLSVIVLTSPGREANLELCLRALAAQTQPAEQIILVDDGSAGGAGIVAQWQAQLPLQHDWRPNDANRSRSRNLGAAAAAHPGLVFLDGDMLVNPHALAYYRLYLCELQATAVFGYHGNLCVPDALAESALIPDLRVHPADERFPYMDGELTAHPHLFTRPQDFTWSASFALHAEDFTALGGFDAERFQGWGFEDFDFGYRLVNAGQAIYFSLDVWAEASPHQRAWRNETEKARNQGLITPLTRLPGPVQILHDRTRPSLLRAWQHVYRA